MNYESLARTHLDPEPLEFSLRFAKLVATGLWPVRMTLLEQTAHRAVACIFSCIFSCPSKFI